MIHYIHAGDSGDTAIMKFESIQDLTETVLSNPNIERDNGSCISYSFLKRNFKDHKDAARSLNQRWDEGMNLYESVSSELRDLHLEMPQSIRRASVWSDVEGEEFSFDKYQTDQPYLRTTKRQKRHTISHATIVANLSASAYVNASDIAWRTAATVVLAELLERAGYRVSIYATWNSIGPMKLAGSWREANFIASVELKRSQDPIDVSSFINVLSGWCLRSTFFGAAYWWRQFKGATVYDSLGMPARITGRPGIMEEITPDPEALECFQVFSKSEAIQWIKDAVEKFNSNQER